MSALKHKGDSAKMERRLERLESLQKAQQYTLIVVFFAAFLNFGFILFVSQKISDDIPYDFISFSLTVVQLFLAIAVVGGFWLLRGAAKDRAEEVAVETVEPIIEKASEDAKYIARRTALEYLQTLENGSGTSSTSDFMSALDGSDDD